MEPPKVTYYLSGPMAGYPELNFPAFASAQWALTQKLKLKVLSPHSIKHPPEVTEWAEFLARDLTFMLTHCRGLILLPGWPQSKGARLELSTGFALDWPVMFFDPMSETLHDMNRSESLESLT